MHSCRASKICCFPGKFSHRLAVGVSAGCPAMKTGKGGADSSSHYWTRSKDGA